MPNLPQNRISPRDKWILGDGVRQDLDGARCEYLIHTDRPRFICRVVDESGDEPEAEFDALTGLVFSQGDDFTLCEFVWIDPAPERPALDRLLDKACEAVLRASGVYE